jgi:UDP-GlcNAc:undecaprenyl-phosphate GlcNAc-1-phosphate transferase
MAPLLALPIGLLASLLLVPPAIRLASAIGLLDQPAARKLHRSPTPLLGGVVVACGVTAGGLLAIGLPGVPERLPLLLAGGVVALGVGLWDDRRGLGVLAKLVGQGVAASFVLASGAGDGLELTLLGSALIWLGLVALMNAVNFLDNMNGVATGLAAIALLAFAWGSFEGGAPGVGTWQLALAGACLGFLPHNFPRSRIFLGDAGSLLLGYSLGASAVLALGQLPRGWGQIGPLFLIGYPVFDLIFVLVNRVHEGRPVHAAGKDHSNHRLFTLVRCPTKTAILIWFVGAALCASALAVQELNSALPTLALSALWGTLFLLAGMRLSSVSPHQP